MESLKNRVVFKMLPSNEGNLHIAVNPFKMGGIVMIMGADGIQWRADELNEWQQMLARDIFDGVPTITNLFFDNGYMTVQHSGAFTNKEIFEATEAVVLPVVQTNAMLMSVGD